MKTSSMWNFRSIVGKMLIGLVLAAMIGSIGVAPAPSAKMIINGRENMITAVTSTKGVGMVTATTMYMTDMIISLTTVTGNEFMFRRRSSTHRCPHRASASGSRPSLFIPNPTSRW